MCENNKIQTKNNICIYNGMPYCKHGVGTTRTENVAIQSLNRVKITLIILYMYRKNIVSRLYKSLCRIINFFFVN